MMGRAIALWINWSCAGGGENTIKTKQNALNGLIKVWESERDVWFVWPLVAEVRERLEATR